MLNTTGCLRPHCCTACYSLRIHAPPPKLGGVYWELVEPAALSPCAEAAPLASLWAQVSVWVLTASVGRAGVCLVVVLWNKGIGAIFGIMPLTLTVEADHWFIWARLSLSNCTALKLILCVDWWDGSTDILLLGGAALEAELWSKVFRIIACCYTHVCALLTNTRITYVFLFFWTHSWHLNYISSFIKSYFLLSSFSLISR